MKRYLIKFLMFISSYFPLYIMLLILHFDKCAKINVDGNLNLRILTFFVVILLCMSLSLVSLFLLQNDSVTKRLKVETIERPDDTIISYMMTYIIPILTTVMSDNEAIIVNIILFLLIGYLYVRLNLLYLNPLWSMFGYLAYKVNADVIIITNIKYAELKRTRKTPIRGYYLANDIFVAKKKNNELE